MLSLKEESLDNTTPRQKLCYNSHQTKQGAKSQRKEEMTNLMKIEQSLTMSTREIAELTGKEHRNVLVDTRKMLLELYGEDGKLLFLSTYTHNQNGQQYPMFNLPKRECLSLLHAYKFMSSEAYAKVVERFKDCEITPKFVRKEYSFGEDIIKNLFNGYAVISQFPVLGKYKLDWYVPELKLAIEFDEKFHIHNKVKDSRRQKEIEKALGCRFLRYNAD